MNVVRSAKLFALSTLAAAFTLSAGSAPVSFWFSGVVERFKDPGKLAPSGVGEGTPFVGHISYDPSILWYAETNSNSGGIYAQYQFGSLAGFSFTVYMAGHTISNVMVEQSPGMIILEDNVSGRDFYLADTASMLTVDGKDMVAVPNQVGMSLGMTDPSSTAISSVALPKSAPVLSQFPDEPFMNIVARNSNGTVDLCNISGIVQLLQNDPIVPLSIRPLTASTARVSWPLFATGYTLQSSPSLNATRWQDVLSTVVTSTTEFSVTVPTTGAPKYYRLKK